MNVDSGMVWERTRSVAERAMRDPKTRESAGELLNRLRELARQDRRRGVERTVLNIAIAVAVASGVAALAAALRRRRGSRAS